MRIPVSMYLSTFSAAKPSTLAVSTDIHFQSCLNSIEIQLHTQCLKIIRKSLILKHNEQTLRIKFKALKLNGLQHPQRS